MSHNKPIALAAIEAARERIKSAALRTPLVRLNVDNAPAEIYLKLENLQPIGSFKLRGASNAMLLASPEQLSRGVWTASAGNMAQGVAWQARRMGLACTVVGPDHAPETKIAAITRLGAKFIPIPFADWFAILSSHTYPGMDGYFVHPVSDPNVMAGNGTIGLEILEDLPDMDTILIPYGGGGLSTGIASAVRALKPDTRLYACEVETAAPLAPSLAAGAPQEVSYTATFVDGIGGPSVLPEMWPVVSKLLDGSLVMPVAAVADALRLLIERNRVVAEGAGATPVATALSGKAGSGKVVCVVSGGNIDSAKLAKILLGQLP
ncbi:MAG TPA: threonine/serine dehydratase [Ktedonobacterales bacterium]|jgi:threonine dehydratase|nr:threonine/serine dehydratase [Ktedonobacterales bacterium]